MRLIFKKSLNFPSSSFAGLTFKFPPGFQAVAVIYTWNFCSRQKHWEDHRTKIWNNFAYPTTFFLSFSFIFLLSFLSFFFFLSLSLTLSLLHRHRHTHTRLHQTKKIASWRRRPPYHANSKTFFTAFFLFPFFPQNIFCWKYFWSTIFHALSPGFDWVVNSKKMLSFFT